MISILCLFVFPAFRDNLLGESRRYCCGFQLRRKERNDANPGSRKVFVIVYQVGNSHSFCTQIPHKQTSVLTCDLSTNDSRLISNYSFRFL